MKKLFAILVILLTPILWREAGAEALAQNHMLDSLLSELPKAKEDTNKVKLLNGIGAKYAQFFNYDTALYYFGQALKLAQELNFEGGKGVAYSRLAYIYTNQGNYSEALKNNYASLKIVEANKNKRAMAICYNNIGTIYYKQGNYPEALRIYFAALKINEEIGSKRMVAFNYGNIGNIYFQQGNYPEALNNFLAARNIFEEIESKQDITYSYINIGEVYQKQNNYAEALKNFFAALKMFEEVKNKFGKAFTYRNIGEIYGSQGNYTDALKNLFISLKIFEEIGDKPNMAHTYRSIGIVYNKSGRVSEGKVYLQKALTLGREIGEKDGVKDSYDWLSQADSALGNYKGAFENYKMFIVYRDSLYNEENTKKLTQTSMQYEFDKKEAATKAEQEKKDIRQANIRNSAFAGLAGLLIFSMAVMRQRNKVKKEKARSEALLLNILPEEVAEELKAKGSADAKQFDEVTVLFTDFKGFTAISEKLSPKDLVKDLNECFSAFDQIVENHGLEKIKTIGDAYMCVGGLPMPNNTHASDAVKAAMEMRDFIEEGKARKIEKGLPYFEIRIGIHTGSVVAGIVGVKKFAYDIWGDTVNTASRMESSGEAGKVNISETTYQLVKDNFTCTHRGKIQAKGKGEIDMYFVEG